MRGGHQMCIDTNSGQYSCYISLTSLSISVNIHPRGSFPNQIMFSKILLVYLLVILCQVFEVDMIQCLGTRTTRNVIKVFSWRDLVWAEVLLPFFCLGYFGKLQMLENSYRPPVILSTPPPPQILFIIYLCYQFKPPSISLGMRFWAKLVKSWTGLMGQPLLHMAS